MANRPYKRFQPWMLNGKQGNISLACKRFIVRAINAGLRVTSTTGGVHTPGSFHYPRRFLGAKGRAVDVAGPHDRMVAFQRREHERGRRYYELFGPDNRMNRKYGGVLRLREGSALEQLHDNHVHGAPRW